MVRTRLQNHLSHRMNKIAALVYVFVKYIMNTYYYEQDWFNHVYYLADALIVLLFSYPLLKRHWIFSVSLMASIGALLRRLQIITGIDPYDFGERRYMPIIFMILGVFLALYIHGGRWRSKIF